VDFDKAVAELDALVATLELEGDERALLLGRVRQHDVRVPAPAHRECLAASHRDDLDLVAAALLKQRQQAVEETRVAGGGGSGENDVGRPWGPHAHEERQERSLQSFQHGTCKTNFRFRP